MYSRTSRVVLLLSLICLSACSSRGPHTLNLMPAPEVYDETLNNPFADLSALKSLPYDGILYATCRVPSADKTNWQERFYLPERSSILRVGLGTIDTKEKRFSWEEAMQVSLHQNRPSLFPIFVSDVHELGVLKNSVNVATEPADIPVSLDASQQEFVDLINQKLAVSTEKDVHVYVHGYKVIFDDPLLIATEFWHFLGYDGVFVAFSWPSTPRKWAYFADLETATYSARHLRLLIKFLRDKTDVERINIIGYSAGTRVVLDALGQIANQYHFDPNPETLSSRLHLGDIILAGSDYDRWVFGNMIHDGLLNIVDSLTVYGSATDKALSFSSWVLGRDRLGQIFADTDTPFSETQTDFLREQTKLNIINVSGVAKTTTGNGHAYFRQAPWVSSDLLMLLHYGLSPEERGLIQDDNRIYWTFPDDYIETLRGNLIDRGLITPASSSRQSN